MVKIFATFECEKKMNDKIREEHDVDTKISIVAYQWRLFTVISVKS